MSDINDEQLAREGEPEHACERKSGRAAFDGDGRASWEWQVSTGVFTRTVTDDQLTRLAESNLQLVSDSRAAQSGKWLYQSDRLGTTVNVAPRREPSPAVSRSSETQGPVRRLLKRLVGAT
jgi:hypothetical protein